MNGKAARLGRMLEPWLTTIGRAITSATTLPTATIQRAFSSSGCAPVTNVRPNMTPAPRASSTVRPDPSPWMWTPPRSETRTMPTTITTRAAPTPAPRRSPIAIEITAAMAPSVATIGVTRLTFPVETAASQHRLAPTMTTPVAAAHAQSLAGASGRPVANAAGTLTSAPKRRYAASEVHGPSSRAARAEVSARIPHSSAVARPKPRAPKSQAAG